jgi:hypothetical protein
MKRLLLYACVWAPGTLAIIAFMIAMLTSRRVAEGELTYTEGLYTILPWAWIPVFLLVPAAILGIALLIKTRWTALLQLGASVGLVFAWIFFAESVVILKQKPTETKSRHPNPTSDVFR